MSIDPVKVPQNVYVEDRIIGPITLRQIMIIMISSGLSYAIWAVMKAAGPVSGPQLGAAWTPTVLGVIFAFVKINGISMFRMVLLSLEMLHKPRRRKWEPREGIYINFITAPSKDQRALNLQKELENKEKTRIEELSEVLDQGPVEFDEEEDIEEDIATPRSVNPERVQVSENDNPIDDIAEPEREVVDDTPGPMIHDITPPHPSHA